MRADEEHFERRYGLRYTEPHVLVRFLDPKIQSGAGYPCEELSLPLRELDRLSCPIKLALIVENKVNLLTLPPVNGAIALGGLGNGVTLLRDIHWLQSTPILYWGDIDVEGFAILSSLRSCFPHARSYLMDCATLDRHERLAVCGTGRQPESPAHLTEWEHIAFLHCRKRNVRLEQERIPQRDVVAELSLLANADSTPAPQV
jgi:hypothetical protein